MSGRASSDLGSRGKSKNSSGLSKRAAQRKAASAAAALKRSVQPSPFALIGRRGDARGRGALSARSLLSGGRLDVEMDDAAARRPLSDSLPALASAAAMLCAPSAAAMLSGGAISRAVAVHGEHVDLHIGSQSVFSRVDIDALIAECADLEAPLAALDAAGSTSVVAPPQPLRRTRLQTLMSQDHDGSASADAASASIITIAPSRRTRTQDAAASTSVMASSRSSRRTSRRLALADSDGGRPVTAAGGASLTVSAAAADIMRNAAAITRLCASMPAPAVAPAGVMTMTRLEDSRELARVRALAAARIDPATRLALSLVLLAAVQVSKLVRQDGKSKLSMPTVRVDLPTANPSRTRVYMRGASNSDACSGGGGGGGGGDVDVQMAGDSSGSLSESAIPLQPGGARAVSAAFAGSADAAVTPHEYSPTPARVPLNFQHQRFYGSELWLRQSAALLDAAIDVAFGAPADIVTSARVIGTDSAASSATAARAVVVRALAGSSMLSVVSADYDIFESDAAGAIATSVSTFGVVGGTVARVRVRVTLAALDFRGAAQRRLRA